MDIKKVQAVIDAAKEALAKTNVEHEQQLYAALAAFFEEVHNELAPAAPATNDNAPTS